MLKIITILIWTALHPVHVTIFGIDYSESKAAFEATLRVYYDDFLIDYENLKGDIAGLDFRNNRNNTAGLLKDYLKEKISLESESKILDFSIEDFNLDLKENELTIGLLFMCNVPGRYLKVRNSILAGIYDDQSNLVILRIRDFEEGIKLTPGKEEHVFEVNSGH